MDIPVTVPGFHVILPAMPGHDLTTDEDYTGVEEMAAELEQWLLERRLSHIHGLYGLSMCDVYLAAAGGAVRLPCGAFMRLYHSIEDAAGQAVGYEIARRCGLYFILPVAIVFYAFLREAALCS